MRLPLKKCNLEVQCKKEPLVHIADAQSRAYLKTTDGTQTDVCKARTLERMDHEELIQFNVYSCRTVSNDKRGDLVESLDLIFPR